jgi:hypothetical protein
MRCPEPTDSPLECTPIAPRYCYGVGAKGELTEHCLTWTHCMCVPPRIHCVEIPTPKYWN